MFCPSFGSEVIHPSNRPTDLTHVETFPGAACLTRLAVMQRAKTSIVGAFGAIQSGSPPGASPYQARTTRNDASAAAIHSERQAVFGKYRRCCGVVVAA